MLPVERGRVKIIAAPKIIRFSTVVLAVIAALMLAVAFPYVRDALTTLRREFSQIPGISGDQICRLIFRVFPPPPIEQAGHSMTSCP